MYGRPRAILQFADSRITPHILHYIMRIGLRLLTFAILAQVFHLTVMSFANLLQLADSLVSTGIFHTLLHNIRALYHATYHGLTLFWGHALKFLQHLALCLRVWMHINGICLSGKRR